MKKNAFHFKPGLFMALSFFIFLPDLFYWNVDGHDIWWHLKSSEHLVQHFRFATPDQYSFTANGLHWNQHSWLGALLYYISYIFFGTDGIIILTVFTKVITSILFFAVTYFFTNNTTKSLLISFSIAIAIHHLVPRPHVFSPCISILYFFSLYLMYREIYTHQSHSHLWYGGVLTILSFLWINIHGEFIVALIMLASIFITEFILWISYKKNHFYLMNKIMILPSLIGFMINPHGILGILYPVNAQRNPSDDWSPLISWGGVQYINPVQVILFFIVTILVTIRLYKYLFYRQANIHESKTNPSLQSFISSMSLFSTLCFILSLLYIRMTWVLIFPILLMIIVPAGKKINAVTENLFSFLLLLCLILFYPIRLLHKHEFENPVRAIQFIKETKLEGNLYAPLIWGGIIIHDLSPAIHIFIDGRLQLYQGEVYDAHKKVRDGMNDSDEVIEKYNVQMLLLPNIIPDTKPVLHSKQWVRVFSSTNESLYLEKNTNVLNFDKIENYYKERNIAFSKENGFWLNEIALENPKWVINYCGIDSDNVTSIRDTTRYLKNSFDQYRHDALRHRMFEFLGEKLLTLQFYEDAEPFIGIALDIEQQCEKSNFLMGQVLYHNGKFSDAKNYFQKVGKINVNNQEYIQWLDITDKKLNRFK